uniref:Uncharacterized protein n=1 Tax=Caenorhabditis tropicalis TaxID=1561998 RepID=A0A1I7T156_9PELO
MMNGLTEEEFEPSKSKKKKRNNSNGKYILVNERQRRKRIPKWRADYDAQVFFADEQVIRMRKNEDEEVNVCEIFKMDTN